MSTPRQRKVRAMGRVVAPETAAARRAGEESGELSVGGVASVLDQMRIRSDGGERGELSAADLAEALFQTTHALKYTGRQCMDEGGGSARPLSFPQARVMMVMADAGERRVRMGELSTALGVTARNVTTIVDGLEREGFIARVPDLKDRRVILLELTPKGQEHLAEVHGMQCEIAERFFAPLDATERVELLRLLDKIRGAGRVADGAATDPCP